MNRRVPSWISRNRPMIRSAKIVGIGTRFCQQHYVIYVSEDYRGFVKFKLGAPSLKMGVTVQLKVHEILHQRTDSHSARKLIFPVRTEYVGHPTAVLRDFHRHHRPTTTGPHLSVGTSSKLVRLNPERNPCL